MARFKFIKPVDEPVRCYSGELVSTGDVVELNDWFSDKARRNPYYEEVKRGPKPKNNGDASRLN